MTTTTLSDTSGLRAQRMLNKVPEVTLYFWVIKILCTTVGETFADNLDQQLNLGLTKLSILMSVVLVVSLAFQFRSRRYIPGVSWLSVVLISVVGTLISDNLTDNYGVALETTTIAFSITLAVVFAAWYLVERTLSIHTIVTTRREAFYWLTILFTFALGTSAGDFIAEKLATSARSGRIALARELRVLDAGLCGPALAFTACSSRLRGGWASNWRRRFSVGVRARSHRRGASTSARWDADY